MKFAGALMMFSGALLIMFTIRKPPDQATAASGAVGSVASGVS